MGLFVGRKRFLRAACVTFRLFRIAVVVSAEKLETITTRVPDEIYQDIKRIEEEEKTERAEVIRRLLSDAIKRWKPKKAIDMLREGKVTLRTAAKFAGLTHIQMLNGAEAAGIPINYSLADLRIDLEVVKKEK